MTVRKRWLAVGLTIWSMLQGLLMNYVDRTGIFTPEVGVVSKVLE